MTKEAYYFSHDANARQDPKILAMISVYGMEGYGRYWVIVETLREQSDYTLELQGKYTFNALAMQMHCTKDAAEDFITDCINEFHLFESDGECFWSNSLLRRMAIKEEISNKRKKAAEARWGKQKDNKEDTSDMQMHSKSNAIKGKESKVNKNKEKKKYRDHVRLSDDEFQRLVDEYGQATIDSKIEDLDNYIGSTGRRYKDHNKTIRAWIKRDNEKKKPKKQIDWEGL